MTHTLVEDERRTTTQSYRAFIKRYFPILAAERYNPFVAWRMRVSLSGEFERYARASAETYQIIYRQPVRYEYRLLGAVLLIVGEEDRTGRHAAVRRSQTAAEIGDFPVPAKAASEEVQRRQLTVIPRVGHVPHREAPDVFQKWVLEFFKAEEAIPVASAGGRLHVQNRQDYRCKCGCLNG